MRVALLLVMAAVCFLCSGEAGARVAGGPLTILRSSDVGDNARVLEFAVQGDGKMLMLALNEDAGSTWMERLNPDGRVDSAFTRAASGELFPAQGWESSRALAPAPGGQLLVLGLTQDPRNPSSRSEAVMRLTSRGRRDPFFGSQGVARTRADVSFSEVVLAPGSGKIVLGGSQRLGGRTVWALARLNTDGSLDGSFGTGGVVVTSIPGGASFLIAQPDGTVIAAGGNLVARFGEDGGLDWRFGGGDGLARAGFRITAVAPGPGAASLLAGAQSGRQVVSRLTADGGVDRSFGSNGVARISFGLTAAKSSDIVVLPTGRIAVLSEWRLAQLLPDGRPDAGYGAHGRSCALDADQRSRLGLQRGGRLVAAGAIGSDLDARVLVSRYRSGYRSPLECSATRRKTRRSQAIGAVLGRNARLALEVQRASRTLGRVNLGHRRAGEFTATWNLSLRGRRLDRGRYRVRLLVLGPGSRVAARSSAWTVIVS